jgi:hypothetical protein
MIVVLVFCLVGWLTFEDDLLFLFLDEWVMHQTTTTSCGYVVVVVNVVDVDGPGIVRHSTDKPDGRTRQKQRQKIKIRNKIISVVDNCCC